MKYRSKTNSGNNFGGPGYRTPAFFRNKNDEKIEKIKAYEKVFRRKSFGRRG